jgi:hypothetical protein
LPTKEFSLDSISYLDIPSHPEILKNLPDSLKVLKLSLENDYPLSQLVEDIKQFPKGLIAFSTDFRGDEALQNIREVLVAFKEAGVGVNIFALPTWLLLDADLLTLSKEFDVRVEKLDIEDFLFPFKFQSEWSVFGQ